MQQLVDIVVQLSQTADINLNVEKDGTLDIYPFIKDAFRKGLLNNKQMLFIEKIMGE